MHLKAVTRWSGVFVAAIMLAACNGVGEGAKPNGLVIYKTASVLGQGAKKDFSFVCLPEQLSLSMTFDHNPPDNSFAYRAHWTSSNPDVVQVSNGDIFLPDSAVLVYSAGVLIPKKAGTATITATFSDLSTSYDVTIAEPTAFTISSTSLSMAKHSASQVNVKATLEGYDLDVTTFGTWSFTDSDTDTSDDTTPDDIVSVGAKTGTLIAGDTLGSRVLQAKFVSCPSGSNAAALAENLTASVNVRDLKTLTLSGDTDPTQPINVMTVPTATATTTVSTTKAMKVIGGFGDGVSETQDLSAQVTLKSSDTDVALPSATNILAIKAGAVTVTATYPALIGTDQKPQWDDVGPVNSNAVSVTVGERTLASLAVTPADEKTIDALSTQQYEAIATFTDNTTQSITRHVSWTIEDTSDDDTNFVKLAMGQGATLAGLAISTAIPEADPYHFNITATAGSGDNKKTATVKLNVQAKP